MLLKEKLSHEQKIILHDALSHGERVAKLAYKLSKRISLSEKECIYNYIAARYHDIGKCKIDPGIILKKGKLTQSEFEEVKMHPVYSFDFLMDRRIDYPICVAVKYHHENFDETGYNGIVGSNIPLSSRIMRICDVYDALTSDRPYRRKLTKKEALQIMIDEKNKFDIKLLKLFLEQANELP